MNVGMNIALILALALAATGISTRYQADVSNRSMAAPGQNLNHNETLVRDTTLIQRADDWSLWLSGEQSFASPLFISFTFYRACPPIMCNHNETLVRDRPLSQQSDTWNFFRSGAQAFAAPLFTFSFYRAGLGCSPWICGSNHNETLVCDTEFKAIGPVTCPKWICGANHNQTLVRDTELKKIGPTNCPKWLCGGNHNETLVRDTTMIQRTDDWSLWLSDEQVLAPVSLLVQFSFYRPGAVCPPWLCNHNETLVRDAAPIK